MKKLILNTLLAGLFVSLNLHAFDSSDFANNFAEQKAAAVSPAKVSMVQSAKKFATDTVASLRGTLAPYVNAATISTTLVVAIAHILNRNYQRHHLQNEFRLAAGDAL